ncbi:type II secretion system inner membrane protein GspF [Anaeromyxobacter oryzisoli]|uniref:type II secretion system inner membrane protein GspF n=1 Tax=Anaeromyxobacter oryzisoli TaxID=2925408 RepID=UPI001F59CFEA|nr:type II secretion system inner membrane protein GspF [Anaeromyxobacter sp. SG63]
MPVFEYKALAESGKAVTGLREADSPKTLRATLRREGIYLTEVLGEKEQRAQASRDVNVKRLLLGRVSAQELAIATRQLAVLVGAGIPLVEALTALVDQVEHERLKRVLGDVKQRVNEGSTLADALGVHPKIFGDLYVNMIRAGETSGALEIVLVRLAEFTESQARLRSKIAGTMAYPIAMMVIGTVIMGILFTVVVPKITRIFETSNIALPWYTRVLIALSGFAASYWWAILLLLGGAVYGFVRWKRSPDGRARWDRIVLKAPVFGRLVRQVAIGRFARTLSTLLKSGVPLLTAMDIVKNILGNSRLAEVIEQARAAIREGESIAAPLKRSGEFPPLVHHMIAVGERSGALEEMLSNVANAYEGQVETTIGALTSLLEPLMIVMMGGVVGFIVFSVLMPILQINNLAGG